VWKGGLPDSLQLTVHRLWLLLLVSPEKAHDIHLQ